MASFEQTIFFKQRLNQAVAQRLSSIRICGEELQKLDGQYPSLKTQSGEDARDILCVCEKQKVKYGLEIESHADYSMPKRIFVYDASEYEKEHRKLRKENKDKKRLKNFVEHKSGLKAEDELYPIINIVLYLGHGRYKGKRSLRELCKKIPSEYLPYLSGKQQDYSFTLLEVDYCEPEEFQSDLKLFLLAMQARNDKQKIKKLFEREDFREASRDLQNMLAVHLETKEIIKKVTEDGEEVCKAMRDWKKELLSEGREVGREVGREEGRAEGREEGRAEGRVEGRVEGIAEGRKEAIIKNIKSLMKTLNLSAEQVMDALQLDKAERKNYMKLL